MKRGSSASSFLASLMAEGEGLTQCAHAERSYRRAEREKCTVMYVTFRRGQMRGGGGRNGACKLFFPLKAGRYSISMGDKFVVTRVLARYERGFLGLDVILIVSRTQDEQASSSLVDDAKLIRAPSKKEEGGMGGGGSKENVKVE